jgi:hypothetical protein
VGVWPWALGSLAAQRARSSSSPALSGRGTSDPAIHRGPTGRSFKLTHVMEPLIGDIGDDRPEVALASPKTFSTLTASANSPRRRNDRPVGPERVFWGGDIPGPKGPGWTNFWPVGP